MVLCLLGLAVCVVVLLLHLFDFCAEGFEAAVDFQHLFRIVAVRLNGRLVLLVDFVAEPQVFFKLLIGRFS